MRLEAALDRYVLQLRADGRAASTIEQAQRHVRLFGRWWAGLDRTDGVETIRHEDLAAFFASPVVQRCDDGLPRRATSANVLRSSLRAYFAYLADAGYVPSNPARLIRRARCGAPPPRYLPEGDCRKLLAALGAGDDPRRRRDRALVELMLTSGLRIGSALALGVEDLDLDEGTARLRHAKGDREEVVFLQTEVAKRLRALTAGRRTGPVFQSAPGHPLDARQARRRLQQTAERAGIGKKVTPHVLRHTFAAELYRRTGDLLLVQQALGHRAIASTTVYATVDIERLRGAVAGGH